MSVLLILSIMVVKLYSKNYMDNHFHEGYKNYKFINKLCTNSYVLYNTEVNSNIDDEVKESYKFKTWKSRLEDYSDNLEYAIFNSEGKLIKKYDNSDIENLAKSYGKEEIRKKYDFFVIVTFNENGNINLEDCKGADKREINKLLLKRNMMLADEMKINKVTDVKIIYAIPYQSMLTTVDDIDISEITVEPNMMFLWISIAIVVMFTLVISYSYSDEILFTKIIYKLPIEINISLIAVASLYIVYVIKRIESVDFINEIKYIQMEDIFNIDIGNILRCFAIYLIFFISALIISVIVKDNGREVIKNNSLIYKFFKWLLKVDFKDPIVYKVLTLVVINFIVMLLMTINIWTSIIISITYSIMIFCIAKKYLDEIKDKYTRT